MQIFSFLLMTSCHLNLPQATVSEQGLMSEYTGVHTITLQHSAAPGTQRQQNPSERSYSVGAKVKLPAEGKRGPSCERHF